MAMVNNNRSLEEMLRKSQEAQAAAEAVSERREMLLAAVCHDLRTPLNTILGWVQLARRENAPISAEEAFNHIEKQARLQAKLISDVLELAKNTGTSYKIDLRSLDLNPLVDETLSDLRPLAEKKKIILRREPAERAAILDGDAMRLRRILSNLVSNAIKFTPESGQVTVSVEDSDANILLKVKDTGCGINPEFLPHLFDRFAQDKSVSDSDASGFGLGLPIVRRLTELHRGSVRAESAGPGKGTTFIVSLPRSIPSVSQAANA